MVNDKEARVKLGKKLKEAREKKEMTQSEVATLANIHVNYYARVERGEENPSLDKLRKIAEILNVTIQL